MGLFDRHHPKATKPGLAAWTIASAPLGAATMWLFAGVVGDVEIRTSGFVLFSGLVGAIVVGSIYWQGWPD
jgi:hypothetical protein